LIEKEYPFVSIIVINYNGIHYLKDCFESVEKLDYPMDKYEVIMGDNASSDGSVEYVKENFPHVNILKFEMNYGFCEGNNKCAKTAKGEYVVFLNNDTIVDKFWLINLVKGMQSEKDIISCGCKMLKPPSDGKKIIDYAGGKITYEMNLYEGIYEIDDEKYNIQKYTGFGCGAGVMVDRNFFLDIGGFDKYYFAGGEEVELGLRAWQYGYKVLYVPSAVMVHKRFATFKNVNYWATSLWSKNILYFIFKNYEFKHMCIYLLESIIFVYFPKMLFYLLKGDPRGSISVLQGIFWLLKDMMSTKLLTTILKERNLIKTRRKISDDGLFKLGIASTFKERFMYRLKAAKMHSEATL